MKDQKKPGREMQTIRKLHCGSTAVEDGCFSSHDERRGKSRESGVRRGREGNVGRRDIPRNLQGK